MKGGVAMPYDDPDPTDPMTFHAVAFETDDDAPLREMAVCFVEEFIRSGLSAGAIVELFRGGQYAGPALAYERLGLTAVEELVAEQFALRGPRAGRVPIDRDAAGGVRLPVLTE